MNEPVTTPEADQHDAMAFLADPANHEPRPREVGRVTTHAAIVFLAGERAFKIKRAVRLPYLDFTSLAARRGFLARELEINRANAPAVYRRLVAVERGADGRLVLGDGRGTVVEWALEMRRFREEDVLSRIADAGAIGDAIAVAVAGVVRAAHARAAVDASGAPSGIGGTVAAVTGHLATHAARFPALSGQVEQLGRALPAALRRVAPLLEARARAGFVRRCHGDLHLGNIVLIDGAPVLFDALEFDERLATIDTLYDLAFLLMDLDRRGERRAANIVLNRYLLADGDDRDIEGLAALPVMLALRAAIRAMVACDRAAGETGAAQAATLAHAGDTLARALDALSPPPARLVAIGGLSGTGKSTLAAALAPGVLPVPGALVLRSDVARKRLAGVAETVRLPADAYTAEATAAVYGWIEAGAAAALAAGHSVVADAVFAREAERTAIEAVAARAGVAFAGIWLEAAPDVMTDRVAARRGDASDATADVVRRQLGYDLGRIGWTRIAASGTQGEALAEARRVLAIAAASP